MVSSRPLRVEELAEVFAINFDEEMCGIPKFEPSWRDANAETAVLSACSTLVAIVDIGRREKIVQFSHFSVQEYFTSDRIATAEHGSHFHIHPKPAHTLLAKACLSFLFHLDYSIDEAKIENSPLAEYASMMWVHHARFDNVSSYIEDGIDLLFDKDKPHFATWIWIYDKDRYIYPPDRHTRPEELDRVPLYYAALCGLHGLVERLLTAHPQDLNAVCGNWGTPLNAALEHGYMDIVQFLLDRGAVGDSMGSRKQTGLYIASTGGYIDVVRSLIDRGANLNAECADWPADFGAWESDFEEALWTPLHGAIENDHSDIALLLLECGANPEIRSNLDQTALCMASSRGHADVVRSLIYHGADLNAKSADSFGMEYMYPPPRVKWTPICAAIYKERRDIVPLLLECGANPEIRSSRDETALYVASSGGCADIVWQLIRYGADPNAECKTFDYYTCDDVKWTPLHVASCHGRSEIASVLLEYGANPNALDNLGRTPLHMASKNTVVELFLEYGVNVDVRDKEGWTPLHKAAFDLNLKVVVVLLDRGADPHAQTNKGEAPFQLANASPEWTSKEDQPQIIQLLSERIGERI